MLTPIIIYCYFFITIETLIMYKGIYKNVFLCFLMHVNCSTVINVCFFLSVNHVVLIFSGISQQLKIKGFLVLFGTLTNESRLTYYYYP